MVRAHSLVLLVVSMVVLAGISTPALAQSGGLSDATAACAGNGYLSYTDAERHPFKNARQCMKYVKSGGTPLIIPFLKIDWVDTGELGGEFGGTLTGAGLLPGADVWITVWEVGVETPRVVTRSVSGDGTLNVVYGHRPCEIYTAVVFDTLDRYGSVIEASAPVPC